VSNPSRKTIEIGDSTLGPYSPGVLLDNTSLYLSGQISMDLISGEILLFEGDSAQQCEQIMKNISALLKQADMIMAELVKTTIFLTNLDDFAHINQMYGSFLSKPYPARSTIQVAALPKGVSVEIEAIAIRRG
jgi:2-iminobutanoate/2-iminopropanoate deaminase